MSTRISTYPINPLILNRWSARAMSGETLSDDELMPLFEAARWAPSSMNNQLWRFVYAKRETQYWDSFFDLLSDSNKQWCKNAAVLIIVLSRTHSIYKNENSPHYSHSFEAGAAFENLALEGTSRGLVVHAIGGFDKKRAGMLLQLSEYYRVECMVAVGKQGLPNELSERDKEREKPTGRIPLSEIVFEGKMPL